MNDEFISQEKAESVLLLFGITKSSSAYERWLTNGGFYLKDFDEVLFRSNHIVLFDWRESSDQIGLRIKQAFQLCGVQVDWVLSTPNRGHLIIDEVKFPLSYSSSKGDQIGQVVGSILQEITHDNVRVFAGNDNEGSDTAAFAILKSTNANMLNEEHASALDYYFQDIETIDIEPRQKNSHWKMNLLKSLFLKKTN